MVCLQCFIWQKSLILFFLSFPWITCPTPVIVVDVIIFVIFSKNSNYCVKLITCYPPISYYFHLAGFTFFPDTLQLCASLVVRSNFISIHEIMIWCILTFLLLDGRCKDRWSNFIVVSSSQIHTVNFFENVISNCYHHSFKACLLHVLAGSCMQINCSFLYVLMFLAWMWKIYGHIFRIVFVVYFC